LSITVWRHGRAARLASVAAVALSFVPACGAPRPPATLHDIAEAYVQITLQFAQHRPSLVDAWTGPDGFKPGARVPVAELRASLDQLLTRVAAMRSADIDATEAPRLGYLRGQLNALTLVARRLLGESTSFAEEIRGSFGRNLDSDAAGLADVRAALDAQLSGRDPLPQRYRAFRDRFLIPESRVDRVLAAAIDACRASVAPYIKLPADERVTISFDPAIEWDAYARYAGNHTTELKIASRDGHDVAALLHLACHETYAGHHTEHVLIDDALVKGRGWVEFQLSPAFGPHLLISEGVAEAAVDLALPETRRAALYRESLLALAGLPTIEADRLARVETLGRELEAGVPTIVAQYLDNHLSEDAALERLRDEALIAAPERLLAFAERHRTGAVVYPLGKASVSRWLAPDDNAQRWLHVRDVFTRKPFTLE
jgi:hypothetical protein